MDIEHASVQRTPHHAHIEPPWARKRASRGARKNQIGCSNEQGSSTRRELFGLRYATGDTLPDNHPRFPSRSNRCLLARSNSIRSRPYSPLRRIASSPVQLRLQPKRDIPFPETTL